MQRLTILPIKALSLALIVGFMLAIGSIPSTPIKAEDFKSLKKEYESAKKDGSRTAMARLIKQIAATNDPKAADYLLDELEDDQKDRRKGRPGLPGDVRDKIIDGLATFTDEKSVAKIGEIALDFDSAKEPILALDQFDFFKALTRMKDVPAADESIRAALADEENAYVKCAALEAIRQTGAKRFVDDVVAILLEENEEWARKWLVVPINVFACLEEIIEAEDTQAVIKAIDATIVWEERKWCIDDRVRFFGSQMLTKISGGETAAMDSVPFWKWWVEQLKTKGSIPKTDRPKGKRSKTAAVPPVFDAAPVGKRFAFVIDVSLSMEKELRIDLEEIEKRKKKRKGPISGHKKKDPDKKGDDEDEEEEDDNPLRQLPWEDIETKMELAREELARAIGSFVGAREFAIVIYSTEVSVLTDGWVEATPSNCAKWAREARELEPEALTNIHGGLNQALMIHEGGTDCEDPSVNEGCVLTGADTIVFLTDGWATWSDNSVTRDKKDPRGGGGTIGDGDFIMGEDIWPDIVRTNLFRKVIINTVGIGVHDKELLKNLAERTRGTYVDWGFPEPE